MDQQSQMEELRRVGAVMAGRMSNVVCPTHGAPGTWMDTFDADGSPGLMPDCCCSGMAFTAFYSFDGAWRSLPEAQRPIRSSGVTIHLDDKKGMDVVKQAQIRRKWMDETETGLRAVAYCEEHSDLQFSLEIVHEDGGSVLVPHGCCPRFEEAAKFFMAIDIRPSLIP